MKSNILILCALLCGLASFAVEAQQKGGNFGAALAGANRSPISVGRTQYPAQLPIPFQQVKQKNEDEEDETALLASSRKRPQPGPAPAPVFRPAPAPVFRPAPAPAPAPVFRPAPAPAPAPVFRPAATKAAVAGPLRPAQAPVFRPAPTSNIAGPIRSRPSSIEDPNEPHPAPEPYSFSYSVNDEQSGSALTREESQDANGNVVGFYHITDAEGRLRRVDYTAGPEGFKANIQSNEEGIQTKDSADAHFEVSAPSAAQQASAGRTQFRPSSGPPPVGLAAF